MSRIKSIDALQILDSRAQPTLKVYVTTQTGAVGAACVPSGASTGMHEAVELRDNDLGVFAGKSVYKAIENVTGPLAQAIVGMDCYDQGGIDQRMKELDGTPNKAKLGANALLGISMATARAGALESNLPLYEYIARALINKKDDQWLIPCPMLNIINGGAHADNSIDSQEFMVRPRGARNLEMGLRWSCEIYAQLKKILRKRKFATGVGDEGGFSPLLDQDEQACDLIMEAILAAGYQPKEQVSIAIDCAASEFFENNLYCDKKKLARAMAGTRRTSAEQIALLASWQKRYPIDSIEDGLSENDWANWTKLNKLLGPHCQIVGDDFLVTNPVFVERAIKEKAVNSVLIKLNQIGTLSETLQTIAMAQNAGLHTIISHRSGETEDTFIADLAVGCGSGQIKTGAPCRSERVAKYNRLLEIERELGPKALFKPKII